MKIVLTALLALALHLLLGWAWTGLAGVAVGGWAGRRGWLFGGGGVGLGWLALILYNVAVASGPVGRMIEAVGDLLGNLPGAVVVGLSLLIGVVLGALGGAAGAQLHILLFQRKRAVS